jgi:hypothetical protein
MKLTYAGSALGGESKKNLCGADFLSIGRNEIYTLNPLFFSAADSISSKPKGIGYRRHPVRPNGVGIPQAQGYSPAACRQKIKYQIPSQEIQEIPYIFLAAGD